MNPKNIVKHVGLVSRLQRESLMGHKSCVIWFTGFSGSGKSTVSHHVEARLFEKNVHTYVLDGDNIRFGINRDLGFSPEDRVENIRRIGEASKLFVEAGLIVLSAFISPYRKDRDMVRSLFPDSHFIEVFVKCPIEVCESRDVKGLYKLARNGKINDFTGISAPYEEPLNPEIILDTQRLSIEESADLVCKYLHDQGIIYE